MSISQDGKMIDINLGDDPGISNGLTSVSIENTFYEDYNGSITISGIQLLPCPEFDTQLNDNGDLIITSDDSDWINSLCETRPGDANNSTIRGRYILDSFAVKNYQDGYPLEKINDNTVSFSAYSQRNRIFMGGIVNGLNYSITIHGKGYEASAPFNITFTNARSFLPND